MLGNAYAHFWFCLVMIVAARVYLLDLFGCTIFANKSATHVHVVFLDALHDLTQSRGYAWGPAALVQMYDNLNDKSRARQGSLQDISLCYRLVKMSQKVFH